MRQALVHPHEIKVAALKAAEHEAAKRRQLLGHRLGGQREVFCDMHPKTLAVVHHVKHVANRGAICEALSWQNGMWFLRPEWSQTVTSHPGEEHRDQLARVHDCAAIENKLPLLVQRRLSRTQLEPEPRIVVELWNHRLPCRFLRRRNPFELELERNERGQLFFKRCAFVMMPQPASAAARCYDTRPLQQPQSLQIFLAWLP
mmetsp:Transcript_12305/g.33227  ORF Transcript_12305/g.33227 Transcript_12305/m.33227 type:complete len:202 (+) Transcript_12305:60-665(+)